jgi:hypothetical protein
MLKQYADFIEKKESERSLKAWYRVWLQMAFKVA